MFPNVGTADRIVRILVGLVMILLALFSKVPAWVGWLGLCTWDSSESMFKLSNSLAFRACLFSTKY